MKLVVEPSAAVPLAVALYNEEFRRMVEEEAGEAGWDIGIVLSGGNVSIEGLANLFAATRPCGRSGQLFLAPKVTASSAPL